MAAMIKRKKQRIGQLNSQQPEWSIAGFKQAIASVFSKLSEQSGSSSTGGVSSKGGLEEMREILSDLQLESQERIIQGINAVCDGITTLNNKREGIKIIQVIAEVLADKATDCLVKLVNILLKRIKDQVNDSTIQAYISDAFATVVERIIGNNDETLQMKHFNFILKGIEGCLRSNNQQQIETAAMALQRVVQAASSSCVIQQRQQISAILLEHLQANVNSGNGSGNNSNFSSESRATVSFLAGLLAMILALEDDFRPLVQLFLPIVIDNLEAEAWNSRKVAVDITYALSALMCDELQPYARQLISSLEQRRSDKIKNIRDTASVAIGLISQKLGENQQSEYDQEFQEEQPQVAKKEKKPIPVLSSTTAGLYNEHNGPILGSRKPKGGYELINNNNSNNDENHNRNSNNNNSNYNQNGNTRQGLVMKKQNINPEFLKHAVKNEIEIMEPQRRDSQQQQTNEIQEQQEQEQYCSDVEIIEQGEPLSEQERARRQKEVEDQQRKSKKYGGLNSFADGNRGGHIIQYNPQKDMDTSNEVQDVMRNQYNFREFNTQKQQQQVFEQQPYPYNTKIKEVPSVKQTNQQNPLRSQSFSDQQQQDWFLKLEREQEEMRKELRFLRLKVEMLEKTAMYSANPNESLIHQELSWKQHQGRQEQQNSSYRGYENQNEDPANQQIQQEGQQYISSPGREIKHQRSFSGNANSKDIGDTTIPVRNQFSYNFTPPKTAASGIVTPQTITEESDLLQKLNNSIAEDKLNEAFGVAITSGQPDIILEVMQSTGVCLNKLSNVHTEALMRFIASQIQKLDQVTVLLPWIDAGFSRTPALSNSTLKTLQIALQKLLESSSNKKTEGSLSNKQHSQVLKLLNHISHLLPLPIPPQNPSTISFLELANGNNNSYQNIPKPWQISQQGNM